MALVLKKCPYCGETFMGTKQKHFCSKRCADRNCRKSKFREKRICTICKTEYIATTRLNKYCSLECKIERNRRYNYERWRSKRDGTGKEDDRNLGTAEWQALGSQPRTANLIKVNKKTFTDFLEA